MSGAGSAQAVRVAVASAVLLVGGGYAVGNLTRSDDGVTVADDDAPSHEGHVADPEDDHGAHQVLGDGRTDAAGDYRLTRLRLTGERVSFRITDASGEPVARYVTVHERRLHAFVFGTDLTDFRHVHPRLRDGVWAVSLPGLAPGDHRVVAEFTPARGHRTVVLGGAVRAPGRADPRPLPAVATTTEVDGYTVRLAGTLELGHASHLRVTITGADGARVDLKPYLGSWTHAALVEAETLAVAHLHPAEEYVDGAASPDSLHLTTPPIVSGDYRLIVEFATTSGVHQAEFTLAAR